MQTKPFEVNETRVLDRNRHDADELQTEAEEYFRQLQRAKDAVATAEADFSAKITDATRKAFLDSARVENELAAVCAVIEEAGGPKGVRTRALRTQDNFSHLFRKSFEQRKDAVDKLLPQARKRLIARRSELMEQGLNVALVEADPGVAELRAKVEEIEAASHSALTYTNYCRQWEPRDSRYSFDQLYALATAPLPTV